MSSKAVAAPGRFSLFLLASTGAWLVTRTTAFSFNFQSEPTQCANLSIAITGDDGVPPYSVLIIPFGTTPLANNIEARRILYHSFGSSATSASFQLNYPADSQFVAVVSDSQTFGNGGTSAAAAVASSSDSSCYDATQNVSPDFFYNIVPQNQVVQCQPSRLWWDPSAVQGNVSFYGVIPGGESFMITQGAISTVASEGVGFNWTANIRGGTTLVIGAGDGRGLNSGGSDTYIVSSGLNPDSSCLNSEAPSSTPGSPAGGSYPTGTNAASSGSHSSSKAGPIAGGVIGGIVAVAALALVLLFYKRRKRLHRKSVLKERPDLFLDNEGGDEHTEDAHDGAVAGLEPPEPYIVPSEAGDGASSFSGSGAPGSGYGYGVGVGAGGLRPEMRDRHLSTISGSTSFEQHRPGTPQTSVSGTGTTSAMGTSSSRKSPAPPVMRPVNIIQHEDAGLPPPAGEEEPETVELPPAYTNIRSNATS